MSNISIYSAEVNLATALACPHSVFGPWGMLAKVLAHCMFPLVWASLLLLSSGRHQLPDNATLLLDKHRLHVRTLLHPAGNLS